MKKWHSYNKFTAEIWAELIRFCLIPVREVTHPGRGQWHSYLIDCFRGAIELMKILLRDSQEARLNKRDQISNRAISMEPYILWTQFDMAQWQIYTAPDSMLTRCGRAAEEWDQCVTFECILPPLDLTHLRHSRWGYRELRVAPKHSSSQKKYSINWCQRCRSSIGPKVLPDQDAPWDDDNTSCREL